MGSHAITTDRGQSVLCASGDLDVHTEAEFSSALGRYLRPVPPRPAVIDLSRVSFIDSTGLVGLMKAHRLTAGELVIRNPSAQARRLLDVAAPDWFTLEPAA